MSTVGSYLEYCGDTPYRGNIMMHVADIMSIVGVFSTFKIHHTYHNGTSVVVILDVSLWYHFSLFCIFICLLYILRNKFTLVLKTFDCVFLCKIRLMH